MGSLLLYGLLTLIHRTYGLQDTAVFALLGDSVTLPCPLPSVGSCSRVHWNMSDDGLLSLVTADHTVEVVRAGVVTAPRPPAFRLGPDCSLRIPHLEQNWARSYVCYDGRASKELSLKVLQMSSVVEKGHMEIHCSLNTFSGHPSSCPHQGIHLEWLREDNTTVLKNKRFNVEEPSMCFSKLIFKTVPTDHRRTWRCRLRQDDTVIAALGYTVNVTGGIEEVFGVVGERVSFSCNTSSLTDCRAEWEGPPRRGDGGSASNRVYLPLAVSAAQSGLYRCSCQGTPEVLSTARLHTLHVSAEREGVNLTLSCELTCGHDTCDNDVSLNWNNEMGFPSWDKVGYPTQNTLISKLVIADVQRTGSASVCSVYKDGVLMASSRWSSTERPPLAVWLALPLGLMLCAAAGGGLYFLLKKRKEKGGGNEAVGIGMAPVYEDIPDLPHEKTSVQHNSTSKDGFYDLLQAVQ